jgi:hypothetical protein
MVVSPLVKGVGVVLLEVVYQVVELLGLEVVPLAQLVVLVVTVLLVSFQVLGFSVPKVQSVRF